MKGFVTVILFFLFALAFAGTEYVDAVPAASMTVCTVHSIRILLRSTPSMKIVSFPWIAIRE